MDSVQQGAAEASRVSGASASVIAPEVRAAITAAFHHRKIAAVVRAALSRPEALCWRTRCYPKSERWDDGPCLEVAESIAVVFSDTDGDVVLVDDAFHAAYRLPSGWCVDGHGARQWPDAIVYCLHRPGCEDCRKWVARGHATLVRLMREERRRVGW